MQHYFGSIAHQDIFAVDAPEFLSKRRNLAHAHYCI